MWTVVYVLVLAAVVILVAWELAREPLVPPGLIDRDDDEVELDEAA